MRLRTARRRAAAATVAAALALVLATPGRAAAVEAGEPDPAAAPTTSSTAPAAPPTTAPAAPRVTTPPTTAPATTAPPATTATTAPLRSTTTTAPAPTAPEPVASAQDDGITVGDRVWLDLDRDGLQEAGEPGIVGATVRLYAANGTTLLASTTTGADGLWSFGSSNVAGGLDAATAYVVKLDNAADFAIGGVLHGLRTTERDEGADEAIDSDVRVPANATYPRLDVAPLSPSTALLDLDAGFEVVPLTLGGVLWLDADGDGVRDATEAPVVGATVRTFAAADLTTPVATATTNATGHHLATGLRAGEYVVEVTTGPGTPLQGLVSTTGTPGARTGPAEPAADPDTLTVDGRDVGTQVTATAVRSLPFTLSVGGEPTFEVDLGDVTDPTEAPDANSNLLADLGFIEPPQTLSLGNRVWRDSDGDGVQDDGEAGIAGVPVRLLRSPALGAPIATTTTDAEGRYLFVDLPAGDYVVEITPPAGFSSSTGAPGRATGPVEPAPDPDASRTDRRDDGTSLGTVVRSLPVTLAPGTAPTGELDLGSIADPAPDASSDLTVDFGLLRFGAIGDFVFFDADGDGVQDAGELGVADVAVALLDAAGTVLVTTTTSADGYYAFGALPAGTFRIRFTPPTGFVLTAGDAGADETADSDPDPATGTTGTIALAQGQTTLTIDAGVKAQATPTTSASAGGGAGRDSGGVGGTGTTRGAGGLPVTGEDTLLLASIAAGLLAVGSLMAAAGTLLHGRRLRFAGARHVMPPLAHLAAAARRAARPAGLTLLGAVAPCLATVLEAGAAATAVTALPAALAVLEAARPGALVGLLVPRRLAPA